MVDAVDETDYSQHTDEELREAVGKAEEEESRVAAEDSEDALDALRRQREAMRAELARRRGAA